MRRRALVHAPEKVAAVEREGVEVTVGDFGIPETLDAALEGAEHAFLLTPPTHVNPSGRRTSSKRPSARACATSSSNPFRGLTPIPLCELGVSMVSASDS